VKLPSAKYARRTPKAPIAAQRHDFCRSADVRQQFQLITFQQTSEEHFMVKASRYIAICAICVGFTLSIASAQTYTIIDYPGAVSTTLNGGPNVEGTSVGSYTDSSGITHGFALDRRGRFTPFDPPGSTGTTPNFIGPLGTIVGGYLDASGVSHGFVLSGGQYRNVDFPGAAGTQLTSLNPLGEMTGFFCTDPACATKPFQGFTVSRYGQFTAFNPPGSTSSQASTVNLLGGIVGAFDSGGVTHGYLLWRGNYVTIDYPGGTFTFAGGNNLQGDIVGAWRDTAGVFHSFLLRNGHFTSFDPPATVGFSDATGINVEGTIVGLYSDSAGVLHGFIRKP
jgi:hypothetical protein